MKILIRMFFYCIVLLIISACANLERDKTQKNIKKSEVVNNEIVTVPDPDELTMNGVKVGMTFTELRDRIPENSEVTLEDFNGYNYHFHFDDNQWTFFENGTLDFILIGKKDEGLDNLLKVGDSKGLIESTLGETKSKNNGVYIYEYSNFEIQIYLEEEIIDTIQMILRNIGVSPPEGDRIALAEFYENKIMSEEVSALETDKLTMNGVKVGMTFTELMDRIPENSEVTLEDFDGYTYHFRFDDNQWTFYENGTLDFILIGKKGEGLDNLLKVGDSKELIKASLGEPELENSGVYIYEYSNFEIQIYLEEEVIDTIRMILRNLEIYPPDVDRIALAKFYEEKIKAEVDERKNNPMYPMTAEKALSILKNAYPEYTLIGGGEISYEAFNEVKGKDEPAYLYSFTSNETGDLYVGWVFADGAYKLRFAGGE